MRPEPRLLSQPMLLDSFGKRVRELRKAQKLRQQDLRDRMAALDVHVRVNTLSDYERDLHQPTLLTASAIATVLGVSLDFLALRSDSPVVTAPSSGVTSNQTLEARKVAEVVDDLPAAQRLAVLGLAEELLAGERKRRRVYERDRWLLLDYIEDQVGSHARELLESELPKTLPE